MMDEASSFRGFEGLRKRAKRMKKTMKERNEDDDVMAWIWESGGECELYEEERKKNRRRTIDATMKTQL